MSHTESSAVDSDYYVVLVDAVVGGEVEVASDPVPTPTDHLQYLGIDQLNNISLVVFLHQLVIDILHFEEEFHFPSRFVEVGPVVAR